MYGKELTAIVVVDDSPTNRDFAAALALPERCKLVSFPNPRCGAGYGHSGGLCVAVLAALSHIQEATDAEFVLKLDTDSLVIGPFENEVSCGIRAHPEAGMFGVIGDAPLSDRTYRSKAQTRILFEVALRLPQDYLCLTPDEKETVQRFGITTESQFQSFLHARQLLQSAVANGYALGEYCQGGGYIVTRHLLDSMEMNGRYNAPLMWSEIHLGEDIMMALQCAAAGCCMYDMSSPDGIFTVYPSTLPITIDELARLDTCIIHSVKGEMEQVLRAFFKQRRELESRIT